MTQQSADLHEVLASIHDKLQRKYEKMVASTKRVLSLKTFLEGVNQSFLEFSQSLERQAYTFTKLIMQMEEHGDSLVFNYQMLNNTVLRVANLFKQMHSNSKQEVLEPLQIFTQNYRNTNKALFSQAKSLVLPLRAFRERIEATTEKYKSVSRELERTKQQYNRLIDKALDKRNDLLSVNLKWQKLQEESTLYEGQCQQLIEEANGHWASFDEQFGSVMERIQYNDQSKYSFGKTTISNMVKCVLGIRGAFEDDFENRLREIEAKQSEERQQALKQKESKAQPVPGVREKFYSYESLMRLEEKQNEQKFEKLEEDLFPLAASVEEGDREHIRNFVRILTEKELVLPRNGRGSVVEVGRLERCRLLLLESGACALFFVHLLFSRVRRSQGYFIRVSEDKCNELTVIFKLLLKSYCSDKTVLLHMFYRLVQAALRIRKEGQSLENICPQLSEVPVLSERWLWEDLCQHLLTTDQLRTIKRLYSNSARAIQMLRPKKPTIISKSLGLLKSMFKSEEKDERTQEDKAVAVIEELLYMLLNLNLDSDISTDIVLLLAKRHKLEQQHVFDLVKKIEASKNRGLRHLLNPLTKSLKADRLYANYSLCSALKLVLPFLSLPQLVKVISLSKAHRKLKQQVFKTIVYSDEIQKTFALRRPWGQARAAALFAFLSCRSQVYSPKRQQADRGDHSQYGQLIQLDVSRSLHIHKGTVSHEALTRVLVTYAHGHRETSYCQGMNYLAGYGLYVFRGDQARAYCFFEEVMAREFQKLFQNEFDQVKVRLYQFERLLSVFLPQVSEHFEKELVTTEGFLINWVITVFSSSLQYTLASGTLEVIWDLFVVEGWKAFFKFVIWLFRKWERRLLELSYDGIMQLLGGMQKNELFLAKDCPRAIRSEIKGIKLTRSLLRQLEEEYLSFDVKVKARLME